MFGIRKKRNIHKKRIQTQMSMSIRAHRQRHCRGKHKTFGKSAEHQSSPSQIPPDVCNIRFEAGDGPDVRQ